MKQYTALRQRKILHVIQYGVRCPDLFLAWSTNEGWGANHQQKQTNTQAPRGAQTEGNRTQKQIIDTHRKGIRNRKERADRSLIPAERVVAVPNGTLAGTRSSAQSIVLPRSVPSHKLKTFRASGDVRTVPVLRYRPHARACPGHQAATILSALQCHAAEVRTLQRRASCFSPVPPKRLTSLRGRPVRGLRRVPRRNKKPEQGRERGLLPPLSSSPITGLSARLM